MPRTRTTVAIAGALSTALAAPSLAHGAAGAPPAGGAALDQIVIATVAATLLTAALLVVGSGHRSGRVALLGRLGAFSERVSGLPGWVAVPSAIAAGSLIVAVAGMYWDIALHAGQGRDEGPLANPAHYLILAGLFGIFSAGFAAMVMPLRNPSATAVRVSPGWYAPLGGIVICACGAFSLLGFPLDDVWHRIFGQDVTLWGPTHLMLIGGAAMTLVGIAVLHIEGARAVAADAADDDGGPRGARGWVRWTTAVALPGALLIGLSTFQGEFDFGVPQFRFVFHPMLVMLAAATALVAARVWIGRGAALGAAVFFLVVRGALALLIGPVLGEATPYFPLYLAEAAIVELVALRVGSRRPLVLGLAAGALIGTLGLAAEWGWTQVFMPIAWPAELLPEGALLGLAMALAGGVLGGWVGARLASDRLPRTRPLRLAAALSAVVVLALVGFALYKPADGAVSARVALEQVDGGAQRTVDATVTLDPADAAADAEWLNVTAWQGGGVIVDELERIAPGVYRTTEPVPVHGTWKTVIRLHDGNSLTAAPIYLPDDPAIPAERVPAQPQFTRELVADHELLQREQQPAAAAVTVASYLVVVAVTLALLGLLAWALHRLAKAAPRAPGTAPPPPRSASGARPATRAPASVTG